MDDVFNCAYSRVTSEHDIVAEEVTVEKLYL